MPFHFGYKNRIQKFDVSSPLKFGSSIKNNKCSYLFWEVITESRNPLDPSTNSMIVNNNVPWIYRW